MARSVSVPRPNFYFGSYDRSTKTLYIPPSAENKMISEIYKMIGDVVAVRLHPADDMLPGFGFDPHKPIDTLIAKVESVNADKDGVSLKLTTEGITNGKFAKEEVRKLFDKVKSGNYYNLIRIEDLASIWTNSWNRSLDLFLEVEGSSVKLVPLGKRILKYDAKEDKVGSVASEKVMAEIGKKLEEDEDVNIVRLRLLVKMKDGNELTLSIKSLEKSGDAWKVKTNGSKKTLDYLKSEIRNVDYAALLSTRTDWPVLGDLL